MTDEGELRAAVASGVAAGGSFRALLQRSSRSRARSSGRRPRRSSSSTRRPPSSCSRRSSGEGEESLLGRASRDHGIAGWVLATRTPLVIEDVGRIHASPETSPRTRATCRRGSWRPRCSRRTPRSASSPCSTARSRRSFSLKRDGAAGAVREPGRDRGRPAAEGARGGAERCRKARARARGRAKGG